MRNIHKIKIVIIDLKEIIATDEYNEDDLLTLIKYLN